MPPKGSTLRRSSRKKALHGTIPNIPHSMPVLTSNHSTPSSRNFLVFCIRNILTTGGLVSRDGSNWHLREDVAGVSADEGFTSIDACTQGVVSSLEMLYRKGSALAA